MASPTKLDLDLTAQALSLGRDAIRTLGETISTMADVVQSQSDRITELEQTLAEAIASIEEWAAYAPDYFQEKWDLQGDITKLRAHLPSQDPA